MHILFCPPFEFTDSWFYDYFYWWQKLSYLPGICNVISIWLPLFYFSFFFPNHLDFYFRSKSLNLCGQVKIFKIHSFVIITSTSSCISSQLRHLVMSCNVSSSPWENRSSSLDRPAYFYPISTNGIVLDWKSG